MTKIFAALHFFENQAKISNDKLTSMTTQQDELLKQKEALSLIIEKMSAWKGSNPTREQVQETMLFAKNAMAGTKNPNEGDIQDLEGKINGVGWYHHTDGKDYANMQYPTDTQNQQRATVFGDIISRVQKNMERINDKLTQMNTQTQRYLTEATDGEARVSSLLSDYKGLLQEMRK